MKLTYINRLLVLTTVLFIGATGCKKFLDVNDNPNVPKTATDNLVLPSTQAAIGMVVGSNLQILGGMYAQYWTQSPNASQYIAIDQYQAGPSTADRMWQTMYADALQDIKFLEKSKNSQYAAIALIEKAYLYQLITDAFGNVPLKEVLQGTNNLNPRYDSQEEVYDSIFSWTKKGITLINPDAGNLPGVNDIIFHGGMESWKQFSNTLLLRAYLRISEVNPQKAQTGIQELYATNPVFLTTDAKIDYQNIGGNQNPLYAEGVSIGRTPNLVASSTAVNAFVTNNDPRLQTFYTVDESGNVVGIPQGSFITQPSTPPTFPSPITGGNFFIATEAIAAAAPVKLISAAESYFLQAEAVARGWATGDITALFYAGIQASFDAYSVAGYDTYIATAPDAQLPLDVEGRIRAIITQKYYAMNGNQSFEAWTEWRRTGYPDILEVSQASALGNNELPVRILYPSTELTRNTNFPGLKLITEKVWWDVN